jgi:hypothetical protein
MRLIRGMAHHLGMRNARKGVDSGDFLDVSLRYSNDGERNKFIF